MSVLLALFAFPLLFFLPGFITTRILFRDSDALSAGERVWLPTATSILLTTWLGNLLAEFGVFSLAFLALLVVLYSGALWAVCRPTLFRTSLTGAIRGLRPDWIFIAILLLAAILVARPAEYVLGGYDAGVYVDTGISIARTGGIALHDAVLQSLPADPAKQFLLDLTNPFMLFKQLRFPGFFVADAQTGLVLPQFVHLYPVWLAIFDSILGFRWGLYGTPVIGLLGSIAAYFVASTLFGRGLARLAFFLLVVDVPQFWFGRYPVAEAMMQFLVLFGMYAFLRSSALTLRMQPPAPSQLSSTGLTHSGAITDVPLAGQRMVRGMGMPLLAGIAFAMVFLTRGDSFLLLVPLGLYGVAVLLLRLWHREHWAFFGAFSLLLVHALAHLWVFTPDYIYFQFTHLLRMKNVDKLIPGGFPTAEDWLSSPLSLLPLVALGLVLLVVLIVVDRVFQAARKRGGNRISGVIPRSFDGLRWLGAAVLVVLFIFAYFIWPQPSTLYAYIGGETTTSRAGNLIKLGWYLSPIGLALAVFGGIVVIRRDLNRSNIFFYGTAALFSVFFIEELYSNPHYIYTMRHYIPLVIPLCILLAALALGFFWREWPWPRLARPARWTAAGALALWLLYNTYAMGLVDGSRATGLALRIPFLNSSSQVGPLRFEPFSASIVGVGELEGALDQISGLEEQLDPNAVVIFSNNRDDPTKISTPLYFLFGRDTFVARFNQPNGEKIAALVDTWRAQGRPVVLAYGTNGGKLYVPRYALEPAGHFTLDVPQWAFAYQFMPRTIWRVNLNYALYRVVAPEQPPPDPFVLNFGGDDYPSLVRGFLERTTGETTRWIGSVDDLGAPASQGKTLGGTLRLPVLSQGTTYDFNLVARAPQEGMKLTLMNDRQNLGEAELGRQFAAYHFSLPVASLKRDGASFLLDVVTSSFADGQGRHLGAELQQAILSSQPIEAANK